MEPDDIRFAPDVDRTALEFLHTRLIESNLSITGLPPADQMIAVVRDDVGEIVAGVYGWVWGGSAEVDLLWVDAPRRHRGTGSALLRAFEAEARRRGATQVVLDTADFQAPDFYVRHGYTEVARVDDYPRGHSIRRMLKRLDPPT